MFEILNEALRIAQDEAETNSFVRIDNEGFVTLQMFYSKKRKIIGRVFVLEGNKVSYWKIVDWKKHYLHSRGAWAINACLADALARVNGEIVLVEKNRRWRIEAFGVSNKMEKTQYVRYEQQYIIPLSKWKMEKDDG